MEISQIIPHIEALIFASDKALPAAEITELVNTALGFIEDRADMEQVQAAIDGIAEKYDTEFYAFELKQSGGGWQFLTKPQYHKTVALINGDKFIKRLSTASLETLSIIAYKQPITKSEIESIRGVNCDYAVQKLLEKDLVIISGRNEDAVGKPLIYATSKSFMDYFGINSANDLPKISELLLDAITATPNPKAPSNQNEEAPSNSPEGGETGQESDEIAIEFEQQTIAENDDVVLMNETLVDNENTTSILPIETDDVILADTTDNTTEEMNTNLDIKQEAP